MRFIARPQAAIAGRIFHLGRPTYRKVQEVGISSKYQVEEGIRIRAKTHLAIATLP